MEKGKANPKGIICEACGYEEATVTLEQYPSWINKPCPGCGTIIAEQSDYEEVMAEVGFNKHLDTLFARAGFLG